MNQVEVDDVETEQLLAVVKRAQRRVVALVGIPHLRGDEQLIARDAAVANGTANAFFVVVQRCRVDEAVARVQGGAHGFDDLVRRHQEDAEAQLRHLELVVQHHRWRFSHDNSLAPACAMPLRGSVLAPVVPRLGPLGLALTTLPVARVMAGWRLRLVARHGGCPRYDEQHGDEREQDDVEHAQRHHADGREQIIRTG